MYFFLKYELALQNGSTVHVICTYNRPRKKFILSSYKIAFMMKSINIFSDFVYDYCWYLRQFRLVSTKCLIFFSSVYIPSECLVASNQGNIYLWSPGMR